MILYNMCGIGISKKTNDNEPKTVNINDVTTIDSFNENFILMRDLINIYLYKHITDEEITMIDNLIHIKDIQIFINETMIIIDTFMLNITPMFDNLLLLKVLSLVYFNMVILLNLNHNKNLTYDNKKNVIFHIINYIVNMNDMI